MAGVDLSLDIGHERITPGLHQADERHHCDVAANGEQDEIRTRHL